MQRPEYVDSSDEGVWLLRVWAQPGARKDECADQYQGCLKIRLAAPAVDNKANKALARFVAKRLEISKTRVRLKSGHASRRKTLAIEAETEPDWTRLA